MSGSGGKLRISLKADVSFEDGDWVEKLPVTEVRFKENSRWFRQSQGWMSEIEERFSQVPDRWRLVKENQDWEEGSFELEEMPHPSIPPSIESVPGDLISPPEDATAVFDTPTPSVPSLTDLDTPATESHSDQGPPPAPTHHETSKFLSTENRFGALINVFIRFRRGTRGGNCYGNRVRYFSPNDGTGSNFLGRIGYCRKFR
jgi:hypothetical protein